MKAIADQLTKVYGSLWSNGFIIYGNTVVATVGVWNNQKSQWVERSATGYTMGEAFQSAANLWLSPDHSDTVEVVAEAVPAKK